MNEPPSPSNDATPDDPVEARIVAWVLGEASAFEAAELERLCEEKPELLVFRRRMRELHGLLTEAEASEPDDTWKLPAEKRKVLDEIFGHEEKEALPVPLLDPLREKRISHSGRRALLAIAACVTVTFFVVRLVPSGYEAEATIEIKAPSSSPDLSGVGELVRTHSPQFFGTEFEKIKSNSSLGKVVDRLDLTARWGVDRESAIRRIKENTRAENIRGTDLISIRVREKTGQDAQEITKAVTQAYAEYRRDLEDKEADKALAELKKAVRDQEEKVEERRKVLATIVRTKGIIYKGQDSFYGKSGVDEDMGARDALSTYNQLTQEKMQLEGQINGLLKYDGDQLMTYASGLGIPDNTIKNAYPLYEDKKRQLESLKNKGLGNDHPNVRALEDQIANTKKGLDEGVVNLRATLQAQLEMTTDRLKNVEDLKDNTREDAIKRGLDTQDYADAKRDFERDQELLQQMRLKELDRTIRDKMTDESIVIHEEPKAVKRGIDILGGSWFSSGGEESGRSNQSPQASQMQTAKNSAPAAAPVRADVGGEETHLAQLESNLQPNSPAEVQDEVRYKVDSEDLARTRSAGMQAEARQQQLAKNLPPADAPAPPPAEPQAMPALADASEMKSLPRAEMDMSVAGAGGGFGGSHSPAQRQPRPRIVPRAKTSPEESGERTMSEAPVGNSATASADSFASAEPPANGQPAIEIIREFDYSSAKIEPPVPSQTSAGANSPDDEFDMVKRLSKSEEPTPRKVASYAGFRLPDSGAADQLADQSTIGADADSFSDGAADKKEAVAPPTEEVNRSLYTAEGNFNLGKYDDAKREYENALKVDPSNKVARRGLEKVETAKSDYYRAAYDHTRAELLAQVDAAWELSVPESAAEETPVEELAMTDEQRRELDLSKLRKEIRPAAKAAAAAGSVDPLGLKGLPDEELNARTARLRKQITEPSISEDQKPQRFRELKAINGELNLRADRLSEVDPYGVEDLTTEAVRERAAAIEAAYENNPAERGGDGELLYLQRESARRSLRVLKPDSALAPEDTKVLGDKAAALAAKLQDPATADSQKEALHKERQQVILEFNRRREMERWEKRKQDRAVTADLAAEIPAAENPYSTFSLNISDASFKVARAAIEKGERPDPAAIKPEQFYNAVDYGDPAPSAGEPVAATIEQSAHPVTPGRSLVRVAVRTGASGRSAAQPLRLTLLVDQSGSMVREDRRAAMDRALSQLSGLLTKADVVNVIGFSRTPHLLAEGVAGDQSRKLSSLVNQAASEGGTNLEEALKLGGQLAARHQLAGAQNRIVLLTDGAANLGDADPDRLAEQVKTLRQKGIAFDIAGIAADDLNDRLLAELARNGNGRYYVVGDEKGDSFARQLAGAFRPAAENVKIQVIFNPRRVARYKLIGFEKDRLKTEDFRNDSVDAAELAAEETGTAIYQVEEIPGGAGEIGELSVRFRDTASGEMVERSWSLPHATTATAFDRATPSMQLAGLSLLAAEKLRGGPLADAIDFKQLSSTIGSVKQYYGASSRAAEMLRLIDAIK
ncbi:MAG: DUF3520 domain-containing protein [Verrucomicrobiaceae bacterium]|nr:MAG: DUF3520 domain-containing protein [Verrucomicrobiaceae bacterium]